MTRSRIWLNGALVPLADAHIAANDRGLLLGDGVFETLLARHGHIVRGAAHGARLAHAAQVMHIPLPLAPEVLTAAAYDTLAANALAHAPRASLRITLTGGPAARGLARPALSAPTLMMSATAAPAPPAQLRVTISSVKKLAASAASPLKTLNYTDNILARQEAEAAGTDDALMLTAAGHIACATVANIFIAGPGFVLTPAEDGAIRAGITRHDVLALARGMGLAAREGDLSIAALHAAHEVFLTNSLWGVCPVGQVDSTRFTPGPITRALSDALDAAWAPEQP